MNTLEKEKSRQADMPHAPCGECWMTTGLPVQPDCTHTFDIYSQLVKFVGPERPVPAKKSTTKKPDAKKTPTKKPAAKKVASKQRPVKKHREEFQLELF